MSLVSDRNQQPTARSHVQEFRGKGWGCFATDMTQQASSLIANHEHEDGVQLSLSQHSDRFYLSHKVYYNGKEDKYGQK